MRSMTSSLRIAIIGSFRRHYEEVLWAARIFVDAGLTVTTPAISRVLDGKQSFVRFATDRPDLSDHEIQAATLERILTSDVVYVVAPNGYIGRTTSYELGCARQNGSQIFYSERPDDLPTDIPSDLVIDPKNLAQRLRRQGPTASSGRPRLAPWLSVDLVVLTIRSDALHILLVRRGTIPYLGALALPGGFLRPGETLEDAASRELEEETGLRGSSLPLRQFHVYSAVGRDPRPQRVITTAFLAISPKLPVPVGGSDARSASWERFSPYLEGSMAFDHWQIINDAVEHARSLLEYTNLGSYFCGETFTLDELRRVYEIFWNLTVDRSNFSKKIHSAGADSIIFAGETTKGSGRPGRPARLYKRGPEELLGAPVRRPSR